MQKDEMAYHRTLTCGLLRILLSAPCKHSMVVCIRRKRAVVGAFSLSPSPGRHKACPYVALSPPRVSVRCHVVPDDGHIRRLDRRLIDNLTITHHQDTVREGQELVQILTHQQYSRPLIAHRHDLRADFSGCCNVETKAGIRYQQYLHGVA